MVTIVVPKNSLTDVINAGLTFRYYTRKKEKPRVHFVDEMKREQFWGELQKYVDQKDKSLTILDFPLPSEGKLKSIDLDPYEYSILYIPSEFIAITPQDRRILLEKGIAPMPQRNISKCFPGDYAGEVEKRWMEISKLISLEDKGSTNARTISAISGIIKAMEKDPLLAVEKIADNNMDFLEELGKESIPKISKHISKGSCDLLFAEGKKLALVQIAFSHFLKHRKIPLGIRGDDELVVLTDSPTFTHHIFNDCKFKTRYQMRLGKGAAVFTDAMDDANVGMLIGKLSQKYVLIKIGAPQFVVEKTLIRRFLGGKGPEGRIYRGIKNEYPGIEIRKRLVRTPRGAIEKVIDTLKETGTKYEIMA